MGYIDDVQYGRIQGLVESGVALAEVALKIGCSLQTVKYWRSKGRGPPSSKKDRARTSRKDAASSIRKRRALVKKLVQTNATRQDNARPHCGSEAVLRCNKVKLIPAGSQATAIAALLDCRAISIQ